MHPHVEATGRHAQQATHHLHRIGGLVRHHESEERFGITMLSCANQAAAFERISRSCVNRRISRRSRVSSSRSPVVRPPSPPSLSRSARLTQQRIAHVEQPNSFESSENARPARTNPTICRLNSGVYLGFDFDILNTSLCDTEVSTKAGQVQFNDHHPVILPRRL